jgi:mono/diheme cytochrome c family protein
MNEMNQPNQTNHMNQPNQTNQINQTHETTRSLRTIGISLLVLLLSAAPACSQDETMPKGAAAPTPIDLQGGEQRFVAKCSACHGIGGVGTKQGPPLVHKIYEPSHHGDAAFHRAAANGVQAHHWGFGNMPKVDGVTPEDVDQIVKYIRWLQKQAGIF